MRVAAFRQETFASNCSLAPACGLGPPQARGPKPAPGDEGGLGPAGRSLGTSVERERERNGTGTGAERPGRAAAAGGSGGGAAAMTERRQRARVQGGWAGAPAGRPSGKDRGRGGDPRAGVVRVAGQDRQDRGVGVPGLVGALPSGPRPCGEAGGGGGSRLPPAAGTGAFRKLNCEKAKGELSLVSKSCFNKSIFLREMSFCFLKKKCRGGRFSCLGQFLLACGRRLR